jgi:hypothetical protein
MTFQEAAVAIGLLTPLVLGVLAFVEKLVNRNKVEPKKEKEDPPVLQGMSVASDSYADALIKELRKERDEAEALVVQRDHEKAILQAELDVYKKKNR